MFRKLLKWVRRSGSAVTESDTERDGLFSYSGEIHGFAVGVYYGFRDFRDWDGLPEGYAKDKNIEKGYYPKTGYVVGSLIRVGLYLVLGASAAAYV